MSCPIFKAGFSGAATVGSAQVPVISWSVNPTVEIVEFKNSLSGVWVMRQPTFGDVSGSIVIDRDFSSNPFAGSLSLTVGTIITNLTLYEAAATKGSPTSGDPAYTFASVLITSTPEQVVIEGKIGISVNFAGAGLCTNAATGYNGGGVTYPAT